MPRRLLMSSVRIMGVAIAFCALAALARGQDANDTARLEVSTFSVEVVVGPASGPMYIPPANPPSKPYTALILVRDSEVSAVPWGLPRKILYAGDMVELEGTYGPYTITCTVTVDDRGETAKVTVGSVRNDGPMPGRTTYQSFTAHLPPSQMLHD